MFLAFCCVIIITIITIKIVTEQTYKKLESEVLRKLGFSNWDIISYADEFVIVKSRQTLEKYDDIKFFKENKEKLVRAENIIKRKKEVTNILRNFLADKEYKSHAQYRRLEKQINFVLEKAAAYRICVKYVTSAGNHLDTKEISLNQNAINKFRMDPSLLMGKGEYNKYLKEQQKEALSQKHHEYYERVNSVIDYANENRDNLVIKGSQEELDNLIAQLFDRTVNSIKKIKTIDSEEWDIIGEFIVRLDSEIKKIVTKNQKILEYYESPSFLKIKETCEVLMSSQREFNEYINEKVQSISKLFGTRVVRNKTINEDEYNYIRPYKKTITPFTAEVSSTVFASAENNPMEYDEVGFYSRLGFANIDESVLIVEYKFSYTSSGGMAQRFFTVPMTEETIVELISVLESKLTVSAFAKEQRNLMTRKLRDFIKNRDNFTCCTCGNSTHIESNLLLEIDHIIPIAKGGYTVEDNLQTLCWKCNRSKSDKILN